MAQTVVIEYLGAVTAEPNVPLTTASILATYPTATVAQMKTEGIKVSVDDSDMFSVAYDDTSFLATGKTYIFSKQCTIAIGIFKAI